MHASAPQRRLQGRGQHRGGGVAYAVRPRGALGSMVKTDCPATRSIEEAVRCPLLEHDLEGWLRCCTARFLPVARRIAGDDDATARDALQESWIIVLEKLHQYRGEPPACGWVGSIVRHEAGHGAARKNREVPLPPGDLKSDAVALSASEALYKQQLIRVVLEAVDQLPPTYREIVRLRDLDEHTVSEVARELHISRSNVAVRLHRAHKLLRCRLVAGARRTRQLGRASPTSPHNQEEGP